MKLRFWTFVTLVVAGSVMLGFWSGRYHELQHSQLTIYKFMNEFMRSTDLDTYLRDRGQEDWLRQLRAYGLMGQNSYIHLRQRWTSIMLFGLLCVAVGLFGLGYTTRAMEREI